MRTTWINQVAASHEEIECIIMHKIIHNYVTHILHNLGGKSCADTL